MLRLQNKQLSSSGVQSLHPLDVTPLVITPTKPGHYTHQAWTLHPPRCKHN
ncbi:hypothetical protein DPMN_095432 [Dreissena polymorpha]|uniref:Uncharacterized protein n=1 Tax=Dreissena polymorpha TaxID=45954 RepID=A0A9D4L9F7_DREPO|nr:hypothetical protein DPMN_095432 [Dreissena polymorpha]